MRWMDGWMLGKCCLFDVSDLFLTFPGVFFNFKKISTGSQTRNNFSEKAEAIKPPWNKTKKRGHVRNEFARRRAPSRMRISTAFGNQHFANTPYIYIYYMCKNVYIWVYRYSHTVIVYIHIYLHTYILLRPDCWGAFSLDNVFFHPKNTFF